METLKTPTIRQNKVDDLLAELDAVESTPQVETIKPVEEDQKTRADESYAAIELIEEYQFDEEEFKEITAKRDVYEAPLSEYEEHLLNIYIKYLLNKMKKDIENNIAYNHETELIHDYLESPRGENNSIVATYQDIKQGIAKENELSGLEKEFASIYLYNKEQMHTLGLDQTRDKKLELNFAKIDENGISTIVMLMEIIILAMFVIMILRLDI